MLDVVRGMLGDLDASGALIGVGSTAPRLVTSTDVNAVLAKYGVAPVDSEEPAPLRAA